MADVASGDLTYSFKHEDAMWLGRRGKLFVGSVLIDVSTNADIPTGGISLDKAKMGCPQKVTSLKILESNLAGYIFEWDVSAEKLLVAYTSAETGTISSNSAGTPSGNTVITINNSGTAATDINSAIYAANNQLEHNTGSDATINTNITFTGDALAAHSHTFTGSAGKLTTAEGATLSANVTLQLEVVGY